MVPQLGYVTIADGETLGRNGYQPKQNKLDIYNKAPKFSKGGCLDKIL